MSNRPTRQTGGQRRFHARAVAMIRYRGAAIVLLAAVLLVAMALSADARADTKWPYESDIKAFVAEVDKSYPFFKLKRIQGDWKKTKRRVLKKAEQCKTDEQFAELLFDVQRCLRDAHLGMNMKIDMTRPEPEYYPGISFMPATGKRVVVMAAMPGLDPGLKTGTVVTQIDGEDARKVLDKNAAAAWKEGGCFSSRQRAGLFEYRIPLRGAQGETHTLTILDDDGDEKKIELASDHQARGWPHTYNLPDGLERIGRSCFHAELPGGFGYLYLRRIDRGLEQSIAQAVAAHPDAKGWVVDLRGNGGGGYGRPLQDALKSLPKPVACLTDAGCISAGETLTRDMVHLCRAKVFGSKTAGSSSAKRVWNFPSGVGSVVLSRRSRSGIGGRPIEYHGIKPDVEVEAVPKEVQQGKNSCILRATEYLAKGR